MSTPSRNEMRELLEQAIADSPAPHPWADIERRATGHDTPPYTAARQTRVWLAAAACTIALIVGFVLLIDSDDDNVRIDEQPTPTTLTTTIPATTLAPTTTEPTTTTVAPTTTSATTSGDQLGWTGGLLDDLDTELLRPLDSYATGDVIIPTAPDGWRVQDSGFTNPDDAVGPDFVEWSVDVIQAPPDAVPGFVVYLSLSREPRCVTTLGCQPSGESVTINGVVWETIVVERIPEDDPDFFDETTLRARVGDRWIWIGSGAPQALNGPLLENPPIIEFLEGLCAGSPEVLAAIGEACWRCGVADAEGDPFAVAGSPTARPATTSDGTPTQTSQPQARQPNNVDGDTGRPLTDLAAGDVVVPTYTPPGLALHGEAQMYRSPTGSSDFLLYLETADGEHSNGVSLWESNQPVGPLDSAELDDPNHPPVEIAGLTWGWDDFESARIAHVGPFSVFVHLHGLDRSEAERFIEGLRAVPVEQFPGPIAVDGPDGVSVINGPSDAEVVASDDRFELTAVRVGEQVCTKLEETTVPATRFFAADCWEETRFTEPGIVEFYPLDEMDTNHLFIGVIDSSSATAVRITSPDGESVVVPTGPVNQAIDGRFFLARIDLDISGGARLDHFTIEDYSR